MKDLKFERDLYDLELILDGEFKIYEVNLWLSEGLKTKLAYWERKDNEMCVVFVGNMPFDEKVNKELFWQIIEEGQGILDAYFWKEEIPDGEV